MNEHAQGSVDQEGVGFLGWHACLLYHF